MKLKMNIRGGAELVGRLNEALAGAAEDVIAEVKASGTMPYETGRLQDEATYADLSETDKGRAGLVSDTEYAQRVYYHPGLRYSAEVNPNAGGGWFQPYIDGDSSEAVRDFILERLESLED